MKNQIEIQTSEDSKKEFLTMFIQKKLNERGPHSFSLPIAVSYTNLDLMGLSCVEFEHGNGGLAILQIENSEAIPHVVYSRL